MFVTKPEDHVIADVLEKAPGEKSPKSVSSDFIAKIYSDTEGLGFRVWGSGFRTFENFCPSSCWPFSSPMSLPLSRLLPEDLDDEALEGLDRCAFCSFFRSFLPFFPFCPFSFPLRRFLLFLDSFAAFLSMRVSPSLCALRRLAGASASSLSALCLLFTIGTQAVTADKACANLNERTRVPGPLRDPNAADYAGQAQPRISRGGATPHQRPRCDALELCNTGATT